MNYSVWFSAAEKLVELIHRYWRYGALDEAKILLFESWYSELKKIRIVESSTGRRMKIKSLMYEWMKITRKKLFSWISSEYCLIKIKNSIFAISKQNMQIIFTYRYELHCNNHTITAIKRWHIFSNYKASIVF